MSCRFLIPFSGKPESFVSKAKNAVEGQNGTFIGNESAGNFDVTAMGSTIKGSYTVTGQNLDINIESKPFFIPCATIESFLKNKMGG